MCLGDRPLERRDLRLAHHRHALADEADVDELNLIAIITGTAVHKAMVEDGRGVGHIVRAGDVIGGSPPYRIVRITRNEVIFRALEQTEDKQVPAEIRKVLLSKEELQEYGR